MSDPKKSGLGDEIIERITQNRMPGFIPTKGLPYSYTSEIEIREKVMHVVKTPNRKVSDAQLKESGITQDPDLMNALKKQKNYTDEEKLELANRWIERLVVMARKQNRLMSEQQLYDWRLGRKIGKGDKAKYIGPTRNELTQANLLIPRENGQTGIITSIQEGKDYRILVFHPDEPSKPVDRPDVEPTFVDLQVRENTPGWLFIERIPL